MKTINYNKIFKECELTSDIMLRIAKSKIGNHYVEKKMLDDGKTWFDLNKAVEITRTSNHYYYVLYETETGKLVTQYPNLKSYGGLMHVEYKYRLSTDEDIELFNRLTDVVIDEFSIENKI